MSHSRLAATGLAAALLFGGSLLAQQPREIAFEAAADFLKLPPDIHFGEVAGVATTSTGNLWVYTRSGGPNATIGASRTYINGGARLFEFDRSGKFLREIGSAPGKNDEEPDQRYVRVPVRECLVAHLHDSYHWDKCAQIP